MENCRIESATEGAVSWERIVPDALDSSVTFQRMILEQHLERYHFAGKLVSGKRVIDAASGSGYGTRILCDAGALRVTGLEIDGESLRYAVNRYGGGCIEFLRADLNSYQFPPAGFDVLVSFETIEHLDKPQDFLNGIFRALPAGGVLVASVPTAPLVDLDEFHKHDFTGKSWRDLVMRCGFRIQDELHQRYCATLKELGEEHAASNTMPGARRNLLGYYMRHPFSGLRRCYRLFRYGLEFEMLTLVAKKV